MGTPPPAIVVQVYATMCPCGFPMSARSPSALTDCMIAHEAWHRGATGTV